MRRFLMIAPYFAPQAAVGAYRSVKLARHLPAHGFAPIVLTGTFPEDARDAELIAALPREVVVRDDYLDPVLHRARRAFTGLYAPIADFARSREPTRARGMNPFRSLLDRYAAHAFHARTKALEIAKDHRVELVYASLGPFSAAPVALSIGAALGLPIVLDLRDPFSLHEAGQRTRGLASTARSVAVRAFERSWITRADHVVLNTEASLAMHRARYPKLLMKSSCIRNAFDASGSTSAEPARPRTGPLCLAHFGSFRDDAPIDDVARGLAIAIGRRHLDPHDIELRHHGALGPYETRLCRSLGIMPFVRVLPRIPHLEVVGVARAADVLVLPHASGILLRVPAKAFDYAGSGAPILAISDNAELDAIIASSAGSVRVAPGRPEHVATAIERYLERRREPHATPRADLSAAHAASLLADVFERVLRARDVRGSAPSEG